MMGSAGYRLARGAGGILFLALAGWGSRHPTPARTPTPVATLTPHAPETGPPFQPNQPPRTLTPTPIPTPTATPGPISTATPFPFAAWTSQLGSPGVDRANGVATDGSGNIIVAGATQGAPPRPTPTGSPAAICAE